LVDVVYINRRRRAEGVQLLLVAEVLEAQRGALVAEFDEFFVQQFGNLVACMDEVLLDALAEVARGGLEVDPQRNACLALADAEGVERRVGAREGVAHE
jgi:hypothetical protein